MVLNDKINGTSLRPGVFFAILLVPNDTQGALMGDRSPQIGPKMLRTLQIQEANAGSRIYVTEREKAHQYRYHTRAIAVINPSMGAFARCLMRLIDIVTEYEQKLVLGACDEGAGRCTHFVVPFPWLGYARRLNSDRLYVMEATENCEHNMRMITIAGGSVNVANAMATLNVDARLHSKDDFSHMEVIEMTDNVQTCIGPYRTLEGPRWPTQYNGYNFGVLRQQPNDPAIGHLSDTHLLLGMQSTNIEVLDQQVAQGREQLVSQMEELASGFAFLTTVQRLHEANDQLESRVKRNGYETEEKLSQTNNLLIALKLTELEGHRREIELYKEVREVEEDAGDVHNDGAQVMPPGPVEPPPVVPPGPVEPPPVVPPGPVEPPPVMPPGPVEPPVAILTNPPPPMIDLLDLESDIDMHMALVPYKSNAQSTVGPPEHKPKPSPIVSTYTRNDLLDIWPITANNNDPETNPWFDRINECGIFVERFFILNESNNCSTSSSSRSASVERLEDDLSMAPPPGFEHIVQNKTNMTSGDYRIIKNHPDDSPLIIRNDNVLESNQIVAVTEENSSQTGHTPNPVNEANQTPDADEDEDEFHDCMDSTPTE